MGAVLTEYIQFGFKIETLSYATPVLLSKKEFLAL
jgi:hypothetical protein